ncbi:MerR family transcriptional regulator [Thalassotalea sp. ND16A]|nr:MerR family transcriptional regulator [Thalassotalea sp. ND16A]
MKVRLKLQQAIIDWQSKPDKPPTGHMICHLIEGDDNE